MLKSLDFINNTELFSPGSDTDSKQYSSLVDSWFGFRVQEVEALLNKDPSKKFKMGIGDSEKWIGLHPDTLQTPYDEFSYFFKLIKGFPIHSVVDFGAGYGRLGIVSHAFFPGSMFTGFELVRERVEEGNRVFKVHKFGNCQLYCQDILEDAFSIPDADFYFLYDFSKPSDIRVILKKLIEKWRQKECFLLVKGAGVQSLISHKFPEFYSCFGVHRYGDLALYSSFCELS